MSAGAGSSGEIDMSGAAAAPYPYHVDLARSDGRCRQAHGTSHKIGT